MIFARPYEQASQARALGVPEQEPHAERFGGRRGRTLLSTIAVAVVAGAAVAPADAAPPYRCAGEVATIVGTEFSNEIRGTPGDDVVVALEGRDYVLGMGGNDRICGGPGLDRIGGGPGDDVLRGDTGMTGSVEDILTYRLAAHGMHITLGARRVVGEGVDRVAGFNGVIGTKYADEISAGAGTVLVGGRAGPDRITVRPRAGRVWGGAGADWIDGGYAVSAGDGDDTVRRARKYASGGDGDDLVIGTTRRDRMSGDRGDDVLRGLAGDDLLVSSYGRRDRLEGGTGGDRLVGGRETSDQLLGGPGADTLESNLSSRASDVVLAGAGNDTADYSGFNLQTSVHVDLAAGVASARGTDTLAGVENAVGGYGDDVLLGDRGPNLLVGANRNDRLMGGGGADVLLPEGGRNILRAGDDHVDGGPGVDTVDFVYFHDDPHLVVDLRAGTAAGAGADTLRAVERVLGTTFDDRLTGDRRDNLLVGREGDDELVGGAGADVADGGAGTDSCEAEAVTDCES